MKQFHVSLKGNDTFLTSFPILADSLVDAISTALRIVSGNTIEHIISVTAHEVNANLTLPPRVSRPSWMACSVRGCHSWACEGNDVCLVHGAH